MHFKTRGNGYFYGGVIRGDVSSFMLTYKHSKTLQHSVYERVKHAYLKLER